VQKGPLKPGFGGELTESTTFGPEYTFGLYMHKHLQGPILIIKAAWGGRDLIQQVRSPSAGKYEKEEDRFGNPTGYYYGQVIKHVKDVLADPGQYHPGYNKEAGYEIAGFVWFQGFNDLVGPYPGGKGGKDYSEYGRLMACFIRDMRKDLEAPKMPFVIGVMGIDGPIEDEKNGQFGFRKAQEAPAALPEFKGNVAAVRTEQYWDMELVRIQNKVADAAKKKVLAENPKLGGRALSDAIGKAAKSMAPEVLTPEELKLMQTGTSNAAFHYMGSAYIYGRIGKALAEAMIEMGKGTPAP
jgi:alpha-galactosidase